MRSRNSDPQPWHFVPLKPGDEARARLWNFVIISILAVLVLGLFAVALVPQPNRGASAATKVLPKIDKDPVPDCQGPISNPTSEASRASDVDDVQRIVIAERDRAASTYR